MFTPSQLSVFTLSQLAAFKANAALLDELADEDLSAANTLPLLTRLRKKVSPDAAAVALETARLRQKGLTKFQRADRMFFTADALQQATMEAVAVYHAGLLAPYGRIADLGCGIGGDALMLGQQAAVVGLDIDPVRLWMARHNAAVYGAGTEFLQADLTAPLPLVHLPAAFFDPARRSLDVFNHAHSQQKRIFSVADYSPPLEMARYWPFDALLAKISPGVKLEELHPFDVGIEFVSYEGDLKEALLHFGELAFSGFRATHLPSGETLVSAGLEPPPLIDHPLRCLYEPDPAVIRSGLFGEMLAALGVEAYRLDEQIAYLTGDELVESPWLRTWQIDDWMPFHLKKLRATLVSRGITQVTVKKRGSPITPEELQRRLALKKKPGSNQHAVLILTKIGGRHSVMMSYNC